MLSKKKKLLRCAWILAAAFFVLNGLIYLQARALTHYSKAKERTSKPEDLSIGEKVKVMFCGVDLPRPTSDLIPKAVDPACTRVTIPGKDIIRLGAWYCAGPVGSPLVLLFHGHGADKTGTLPEARAFLAMGYSILMVDFRGSGDSSESYTTIGYFEGEDVASAFVYAKANLPHSKLYLYGQSMGAAAILRAVHACGVKPDAIIAEAVYDRLLTTVKNRFTVMGLPSFPVAHLLVFWGGVQEGFDAFSLAPEQYAASVHCPILFLQGGDDTRARPEDARRVFDATTAPKQFRQFAGLGHEAIIERRPAEWKQVVGIFLQDAGPRPLSQ